MKYFIHIFVIMLFALSLNAQNTWKFSDFKAAHVKQNDTVYVINFWATWCVPCVKELPEFEKSIKSYNQKPVKFYFLSLDFGDNAWKKANNYLDKRSFSFDSFLTTDDNANEWIPIVDESWSGAIPATVIYKGNKKTFHEGKITSAELNEYIDKMLN
ncbi:MAG TPA: TlpA disulfide reductase family protein [Salinivirga sp.]|uniref:TlpA family protein disulfide reductase n=1 Tax=Salinivirga sp. TaxID=1970192 RepID=UPI002B4A6A8C|nr:TlpA disulfide reductase family protein [Salinivirga sp.]HKK59896.1 TlpA disulfide reductase family protein [Salinivirga sp.]